MTSKLEQEVKKLLLLNNTVKSKLTDTSIHSYFLDKVIGERKYFTIRKITGDYLMYVGFRYRGNRIESVVRKLYHLIQNRFRQEVRVALKNNLIEKYTNYTYKIQ